LINAGSFGHFASVAGKVAIAHVVGIEEKNVRSGRFGGRKSAREDGNEDVGEYSSKSVHELLIHSAAGFDGRFEMDAGLLREV
jgi:hypothetical protein